ncbi:MAG: hypothetical protein KDE34_20155, partial [Anaerolineales bacterium]|nr:hypothetical protein [Anaerolineales bacterium]
MSRLEFEAINLGLIQAQKEVRERDRLLDIMAGLDRRLGQLEARLVDEKARAKKAVREYRDPPLYSILSLGDSGGAAGRRDRALAARLAVEGTEAEIAGVRGQIAELESQLIDFANSDERVRELASAQLALIQAAGLEYGDELARLSAELSRVEAAVSEYGEAMTWQGRALQNLHRLDELVASLRNVCNVFVESRIHDNNLQKMDDSLSETYDWMHRTHMSLRRYEREMADTTQALPAGFADQPPFDKAFHIPFILPRRLETIADWHHFVRQR